MALSFTRILGRRNLGFNQFRNFYTCKSLCASTTNSLSASSVACETEHEKNIRLKRPLSPHLSIYQVQLTWFLSITHRATGILLSTYAITLGCAALFVPGGVPCLVEGIHNLCLPAAVLFAGKFLLAFPATYHYFNGIRHLLWDLGTFLSIKNVYSTGYIAVALGAIAALALAAL